MCTCIHVQLDAHVPFPLTLEFAPFAAPGKLEATHYSQLPTYCGSDGTARYRLYGVVEHQGSVEGGHYVAFVKSDDMDCWHRFNDSVATRVDEPTVLRAQAFLLFYERFSSA